MKQVSGIGVLTTVEHGEPRLRPLELSLVDGEWWAAAPEQVLRHLKECIGQHVEVLFMNAVAGDDCVHGVLECSTNPSDIQRLGELGFSDQAMPQFAVVKIIPDDEEERPVLDDDHNWQ